MKNAFWNSGERRLRAGWRILLFFLAVASLGLGLVYLAELVLGGRPSPGLRRELLLVGALAISTTVLLPFARRFVDKRSVVSLGLHFDRAAVGDLVFGWLLSGAMAALFFLSLFLAGAVTVNGFAWDGGAFVGPLLLSCFLYLLVGWWEELFFRGYIFANLISGLGLVVAVVVSCVIYGLLHASNPSATVLSTIIIVGFGFLRIHGLLTTRQLWLSMGMHMGWNFFQGPVFGFSASGRGSFKVLTLELDGAGWFTGGDFGPEGSILMLPILGGALLVMQWWASLTRTLEQAGGATDTYPRSNDGTDVGPEDLGPDRQLANAFRTD